MTGGDADKVTYTFAVYANLMKNFAKKVTNIMDQKFILTQEVENVGYIILNKPERKNAIDVQMMLDITAAIERYEFDPEVRVIVIKGADHCFYFGGDLAGRASSGGTRIDVADGRNNLRIFNKTISTIQNCDKPVIAMVESYAIGGGFSLALACDFIIAAEDAKMASNFLHVGLAPEMGSRLSLPMACGIYRAKELWYSGRRLSAKEAYEWGIVSRVSPTKLLDRKHRNMQSRLQASLHCLFV